MTRAVIRDPEDAAGGTVRLLTHDLGDQAVKRGDADFRFAAAKDLGPPYIPDGQIGPSALSLILVFDVLGTVRGWGQGSVSPPTGLNTGLLVSAHHKVGSAQGHCLPDTLVEIENPRGLFDKGGIAGKNPTAKAPRAQRVAAEPAPKGGAANLGRNALGSPARPLSNPKCENDFENVPSVARASTRWCTAPPGHGIEAVRKRRI
jgi:hypothetical protein